MFFYLLFHANNKVTGFFFSCQLFLHFPPPPTVFLRHFKNKVQLWFERMKTREPFCSVCQTRYDEELRVPLLLQCGHGFCRDCLSRMFSASTDTTLTCPRCRHVSSVGNSVHALPKNFPVLALLRSPSSSNAVRSVLDFDFDYTDDEDEDPDQDQDYRSYLKGKATQAN